jgi:DNA-binding MarR family transcriptional regulator
LEKPTNIQPQEHAMSSYPPLNTQVIGQTESALGALLEPLLADAGITFQQWLVLTIAAASGGRTDRGQLVARIAAARKVDGTEVESAIAELTAAGLAVTELATAGLATAGLATATGLLALTDSGQDVYQRIRGAIEELNAELFAFPPEDLATAGRILSIVTERANAVLARHA